MMILDVSYALFLTWEYCLEDYQFCLGRSKRLQRSCLKVPSKTEPFPLKEELLVMFFESIAEKCKIYGYLKSKYDILFRWIEITAKNKTENHIIAHKALLQSNSFFRFKFLIDQPKKVKIFSYHLIFIAFMKEKFLKVHVKEE